MLFQLFKKHFSNMMEDKKRKKFGLSLKNAKRLAVIKSEVNQQRSTKTISSITLKKVSKEPNVVVNAGQPSCDLQECDLKGKLKKPFLEKTFGKEKLVCRDDDQDRESIIWRNLFSTNSTTNWETMEDLPILDVSSAIGMKNEATSSIKLEKKDYTKNEDAINISPGSLTDHGSWKMDAIDVDLGYKELPKPCIACYARKNHPLKWSQDDYDDEKDDDNDDNDKKMEEIVIHGISPPPKDCALDINNSNIKGNCSQNNISSIALVQKSLSLKSFETNEKHGTLFNQDVQHKKKSYLKTNLNSSRIVENNKGSFSESPARNLNTLYSPLKHLTTASDLSPKQESLNRRKFGKFVDSKKPSGFINAFKVKSKLMPNSNVGDLGAKRNIAAAKKEILQCCPICQLQFSQATSKEDIDQHISHCIRSEDIFIDDEEEW